MKPHALIVRTAGTNCDGETAFAFRQAGAVVHDLHINALLADPSALQGYQLLAFPGGFSYGDDVAAGKILANQIMHHLHDELHEFVAASKPIIGICNGFQVLIKTDLLPGPIGSHSIGGRIGQTATLTNNQCGRFIDRWVHLEPRAGKCIWTAGIGPIELPIAHGEGKFVPADEKVRRDLWNNGQVALVYTPPPPEALLRLPLGDTFNPNGSVDDIAGICDETGLVFGLMPHPERHIDPMQHPAWTRQNPLPREGQGLQFFRNAIKHVEAAVGAGI